MKQFLSILTCGLLCMTVNAQHDEMSATQLENRLAAIDAQLSDLATYSLGNVVGAIGYRTLPYETADHPEWIQVDFGDVRSLDEVHLVPAIRRSTKDEFLEDAFPAHFRLIAGVGTETNDVVIAEFNGDSAILPRIAPLIIPCNGVTASWIRIEVDKLPFRVFDERYAFQLSEVFAFSGGENVALHKPVKTSSSSAGTFGWDTRYIVDGFTPYLMDAAHGDQSMAYLTPSSIRVMPSLTVDLGESVSISRLLLHTVDQGDTLPQAFIGDVGIPKHMRVSGANKPDFSDARTLLDLHYNSIYDVGPMMAENLPKASFRYVRFSVIEPKDTSIYGSSIFRFGFAEIEIFSDDRNVALGKPIQTNFIIPTNSFSRPIETLTDGQNVFGNILPLREWLGQLAERHELETERPIVMQELNDRYMRQKANLRLMAWLIALLIMGTIIIILIDRIIRQRAIHRTRERIAADVHDELGANLHAIGIYGDLVQSSIASPEKHKKVLKSMRELTERTGEAARHCTNMLESEGLYEDLVEDMRRTSVRIMDEIEHHMTFSGEEILKTLKLRKRIDLFLFYKECLINIIRHSGATQAHTALIADKTHLSLIIDDNGQGIGEEVPSSLKRRARLLGARVFSEKSESGGTRIVLKLKLRKSGVFG